MTRPHIVRAVPIYIGIRERSVTSARFRFLTGAARFCVLSRQSRSRPSACRFYLGFRMFARQRLTALDTSALGRVHPRPARITANRIVGARRLAERPRAESSPYGQPGADPQHSHKAESQADEEPTACVQPAMDRQIGRDGTEHQGLEDNDPDRQRVRAVARDEVFKSGELGEHCHRSRPSVKYPAGALSVKLRGEGPHSRQNRAAPVRKRSFHLLFDRVPSLIPARRDGSDPWRSGSNGRLCVAVQPGDDEIDHDPVEQHHDAAGHGQHRRP